MPGGFGIRGIEGKIAAAGYAREQNGVPYPRPVPRPALRGHRVRARRVRARGRELVGVRPAQPASGHRPDGRAEVGRRHGRHDAPRRVPGAARGRAAACATSTAKRSCTSGTATATSSTTGTARCSRSTAWCCSGTLARRPARRVHRAAAVDAPVLRGDAGAPGVQEPAEPPAPAVRRVRRGRARAGRGSPAAAADRRDRTQLGDEAWRRCRGDGSRPSAVDADELGAAARRARRLARGRARARRELAGRVPPRPAPLRGVPRGRAARPTRPRSARQRVHGRTSRHLESLDATTTAGAVLAPSSIARALVAVRSFHGFCAARGTARRPTRARRSARPAFPQGIPKALDEDAGRAAARRGHRRRPAGAARPRAARDCSTAPASASAKRSGSTSTTSISKTA